MIHVKDNSATHTATVSIAVYVNPINEITPAFSPVTLSLSIPETTAISTALTTVPATDADASPHNIVAYDIVSGRPT